MSAKKRCGTGTRSTIGQLGTEQEGRSKKQKARDKLMPGKLSKRIPARTETVQFTWIRRNFMEMSKAYRDIRKTLRRPMDTCFWCKYNFQDGESMNLAAKKGSLNVILCDSCANEAEADT